MLVDERIGSKELLPALKRFGVPVDLAHLDYGDFCFEGRGEKGTTLSIGVERKTTKDLVGSFRSGRFQGHQLAGLLQSYDRAWLLIEGIWRHDDQGRLCRPIGNGRWAPISTGLRPVMARDLIKQVLTVSLRGGLHVWQTGTERDTVMFLSALYHFWSDKDLDEHKSHLAFHQTDIDKGMMAMIAGSGVPPAVLIAKELPGIGMKKAWKVAKHFGTPEQMAVASVHEWTTIEGIGRTMAERIHAWWRTR